MDYEQVSKKVGAVTFSLVSPEQIKKLGVAKIVTPELYDMGGYPVDGGLMDLRLGAIDPGIRCRTCGGKLKECLGHFGFIELARPVVHVKYVPMIELLLRSTCQECGKILLNEENVKKYKNNLLKKAKDVKKCPHCKSEQEKVKLEKPTTFMSGKKRIFPSEVRARLTRIPDDDCILLGIDPIAARPEWGILTLLMVPPVTARPSITLDTGERSEDDLTHKLGDIIRSNQRLWENLNAGAPEVIIEDLWDLLQYHVTTFFDNGISQVPPARHRSGQPLETVTERIEGKEGRIRHNLIGKRVNFSSRCVISPDPSLRLNEVGIPYEIARVLTVPEKVTSNNIERLKELVQKGDDYPGAVYIIRPDGKKKRITEELKQELLDELTVGYVVERHLKDGDIVLFNRHPSLHRASLMSHYAKILPGKTFRLHPGVASPYNADFDGDEMNVHVPQTEEAMSEAKTLLNVDKNLISPRNNTNLLGCITDAVTGGYLLSINKLPRKNAIQMLVSIGGDLEKIEHLKGQEIDGKKLFSAILPKVSIETKTKSCKGKDCKYYDNCKKENCPTNDYLSIKNGDLVSGVIDSSIIGVEGGVLIKEIDRQMGRRVAMDTLEKLFALGTAFLSQYGFTISLSDVNMPTLQNSTSNILKEAWKKTDDIIASYDNGTLEVIPGKTREDSREMKILHTLNEVRSKLGELVKKEIPTSNPANVMIKAGSAGNILYITQMACSVGQQALWAKRIELGYSGRTLSFFKKHELSPLSRGFIKSGFFRGLEPYEFFFGAIAGRDALMDTALRTPKSGYLYRRITNALQDFKVEYDFTVRDATGKIIQFMYGNDGADVSRLHMDNPKIDPGEAIGLVTAQSFGEPSTQMALSVFHFAGISEMQITLGLPRLIEIFDARKLPSTPQMEIYLDSENNNDEKSSALAKKIKEVKLKDVASEINVEFTDGKIEVKLDKSGLQNARLTAASVVKQLEEKNYSASLKEDSIIVNAKKVISQDKEGFKELYKIKEKLKDVIIGGVKGISQVIVKKDGAKYIILTAGSNLEEILKLKGVDAEKTTTNNIHEVYEVLGIEAARQTIMKETKKVITEQGLDIDDRHILLVADAMTASGEVKGMTRIGIISEKSSIFARASFETPIKHFMNASIHGSVDNLDSIIENVIVNQPVPVGTGLPGLFVKITGRLVQPEPEKKKAKKKKE